mmetsp:Transcript_2837/g.11601  ORF Transcript_2837/g.11601 Transcript_2837/m.11601 type:complete len:301 (+) Transcript_2837:1-903(+)
MASVWRAHLHARPEGRTSQQRSPDARHVRYGRLRDHPVRPRAPARRDGRPQGRARAHRLQGWGSGGSRPPRAYRLASPRRDRGSRGAPGARCRPRGHRGGRRRPGGRHPGHLPRLPPRHPGLRGLHHRAPGADPQGARRQREEDGRAHPRGQRHRGGVLRDGLDHAPQEGVHAGGAQPQARGADVGGRQGGPRSDSQRPRVRLPLHRQGRRGHLRVQQGCRAHAGVRDGVEQPGGCAGAEEGVQGCHRGLRGVSHPVARKQGRHRAPGRDQEKAGASRSARLIGVVAGEWDRAINTMCYL